MTTTFPTDNRTILHEADATAGWTATDGPTLFTASPTPIESSGCLGMQVSNETQNAYDTISSTNMSYGSLSIWVQDRAEFDTTANVGIGIQVSDGTDRIAYAVGGSDGTGFRHDTGPVKWTCFILDLGNKPSNFAVLSGTEANLSTLGITAAGIYFKTLVKSVGGTDNCFWDIMRWAAPGADVVMQGGTTAGAAGNGAEAAAVDRGTGNQQAYGVIRELAEGVYGIQGNLTIGNSASATNQFWEETNVTYAWEGRRLSDRNYYRFNFVGRTSQTSSVIFTTSTLSVPSSVYARLDANGANLDVVTFDACTFIGWNVGIVGSDDTGDNWTNCAYIRCAALEAKGCDHTGSEFSNGLACALIEGQDETSYSNRWVQGSGYAASDTITLSNGALITIDTVTGSLPTSFTVTTSEGFPAYPGQTLTQASTSGSGTGFELWPTTANLAEGGSIWYDLNVDPDGELDDCTFTKGTVDTHAIVFGPNIPASITLRNITFSGYSASNNVASSTLHFLDTTGTITVNIAGGTTPTYKSEGATIVISNTVTVLINGVAEGTAVKVVANETVGTVTSGDVLGQGLANSAGEFSFTIDYEAAFDPSGLDVLIRARNQGLPTAAIADDGGSLTDETTEANSSTSNDMTLTPTTPAVNDKYYFGATERFSQLKINVSTASSDTGQTIDWQYWTGIVWASLSNQNDGTNAFKNSGLNYVTWTNPGTGWNTTTVNSQGPYYYVRAVVTSVGGTPNQALGRWCSLDVTRYLPIPPSGDLQRTITSAGLTATLSQAVDTISIF